MRKKEEKESKSVRERQRERNFRVFLKESKQCRVCFLQNGKQWSWYEENRLEGKQITILNRVNKNRQYTYYNVRTDISKQQYCPNDYESQLIRQNNQLQTNINYQGARQKLPPILAHPQPPSPYNSPRHCSPRPPLQSFKFVATLTTSPPHFLYFCLFPEMPNDDATFWQDNRQIFLNCWLLPIVFSIPRGKVIFSTGKYLYIGLLELFVRGRDRRGEG